MASSWSGRLRTDCTQVRGGTRWTHLPMYEIIVPTRNRYGKLQRLLSSIDRGLGVDRPAVTVIDDGSSDETRFLSSDGSRSTRVIHAAHGGAGRARNLGASLVNADSILFLDDDCIVPAGYRAAMHTALASNQWDLYGGATRTWTESGRPLAIVTRFLRDTGHLAGPYYGDRGNLTCLPTANLLVRTRAFRLLGGFDSRFPLAGGEDSNFTQRAILRGLCVRSSEALWVYHEHIDTLVSLCRKFHQYGIGNEINRALLTQEGVAVEQPLESLVQLLVRFPMLVRNSRTGARRLTHGRYRQLVYRGLLLARQLSYDAGRLVAFRRLQPGNQPSSFSSSD